MKWKKTLPILGLGLGFALPAWAEGDQPEAGDDTAEAAPAPKSDGAATEHDEVDLESPSEAGKFVIGLRLGYALPMGSTDNNADGSSNKMTDGISGQFPIWLDLGYMVTPHVMLGLYGQYAFGSVAGVVKTACDQAEALGVSCSASDIRFGIQGQYHVSPSQKVDPWVGLGVGYEMLKISVSGGGQELSTTAKGFEFVNFQGGADFKVLHHLGVGPFISFSLGQYGSTSNSGSLAAAAPGGDIANKAIHEWLTFGVRGAFTL